MNSKTIWLLIVAAAATAIYLALNDRAVTIHARAGDEGPHVATKHGGEPMVALESARRGGNGVVAKVAAPDKASLLIDGRRAVDLLSTTSPRAVYERRDLSFGKKFNELVLRSDADAIYFAERSLMNCMLFLVNRETRVDMARPLEPSDPLSAKRLAAFEAMRAACEGFQLAEDVDVVRASLRARLDASNDPRRSLSQLPKVAGARSPAEVMRTVVDAASSGDPYVLEAASQALPRSLDMRAIFTLGPSGEPIAPALVGEAFLLAACDRGLECGLPTTNYACALLGQCNATSHEEFLREYILTPQDYLKVQSVRQEILNSVISGIWASSLIRPLPVAPRGGPPPQPSK